MNPEKQASNEQAFAQSLGDNGMVHLWQTRRWRAVVTPGWFLLMVVVAMVPELIRHW